MAVTWDGIGSWWANADHNQAAIDRMVSRSVRGLTNQKSDALAWSAIIDHFNRTHGRGDTEYKAGDKIAIKANLNNTTDHSTGPGKVPQSSIIVFDSGTARILNLPLVLRDR